MKSLGPKSDIIEAITGLHRWHVLDTFNEHEKAFCILRSTELFFSVHWGSKYLIWQVWSIRNLCCKSEILLIWKHSTSNCSIKAQTKVSKIWLTKHHKAFLLPHNKTKRLWNISVDYSIYKTHLWYWKILSAEKQIIYFQQVLHFVKTIGLSAFYIKLETSDQRFILKYFIDTETFRVSVTKLLLLLIHCFQSNSRSTQT